MFLIPIAALAADPPALVPKTGLTYIYATGDNGYYQTGVASSNPRFTDNTPRPAINIEGKNVYIFRIKKISKTRLECKGYY
jgi:hypothetical protein